MTSACLPSVASALVPAGSRLDFAAFRNGDQIGWHRLSFVRDGQYLHVLIDIDFAVKFTFLTLYRYRHTSEERWRDGRLVSLRTRTDDNGAIQEVHAQADGDRLLVERQGGATSVPGDILPTSYWHEGTVERREWLDTGTGRVVRATVKQRGVETIGTDGRSINAMRYTLAGDLNCDIWYGDGRWQKLRFDAKGSTIDYQLRAHQGGTALNAWSKTSASAG